MGAGASAATSGKAVRFDYLEAAAEEAPAPAATPAPTTSAAPPAGAVAAAARQITAPADAASGAAARPRPKKQTVMRGCECDWCERISWDMIVELRGAHATMDKALKLREVDKRELEALLQVKMDAAGTLRERVARLSAENDGLRERLHDAEEQSAMLSLRAELHGIEPSNTEAELEELLMWKMIMLEGMAEGGMNPQEVSDPTVLASKLRELAIAATHEADEAARIRELEQQLQVMSFEVRGYKADLAKFRDNPYASAGKPGAVSVGSVRHLPAKIMTRVSFVDDSRGEANAVLVDEWREIETGAGGDVVQDEVHTAMNRSTGAFRLNA